MPTFIDFLAKGGTVSMACKAASIARTTAYKYRQRDEVFAVAWHEAEEDSTEILEAEAHRRAVQGLVRNKYDAKGNLLCEELVYSDTLLIFLLKARRPEKYRERFDHRHSHTDPAPDRVDLSKLSLEEARTLQDLLAKARHAAPHTV